MVRVSGEVVPNPEEEERQATLDLGREMRIAALAGHDALSVLWDVFEEAQEEMAKAIGRGVLKSGKAVDQRRLDYTRGHADGGRFWLRGRIALAAERVRRHEEIQAHGDTDPRSRVDIDPRTGDPRHEGVGQQ